MTTSDNDSSVALPVFHDKNGFPIYPGDLLRSLHFVGARRKKYWLYHVVTAPPDRAGTSLPLYLVPTSHLEPTKQAGGGRCPLTEDMASSMEILAGHGPGDILDYEDRPRIRRRAKEAAK